MRDHVVHFHINNQLTNSSQNGFMKPKFMIKKLGLFFLRKYYLPHVNKIYSFTMLTVSSY